MKPRYSVMRIERAKQRALTGNSFKPQKGSKGRYEIDWTRDDEKALNHLIAQWDEKTGHAGLNDLIDFYKFSHGTHFLNAHIDKLITVDTLPDGMIRYIDPTHQDWMPKEAWQA